jgi:hypothetical protein
MNRAKTSEARRNNFPADVLDRSRFGIPPSLSSFASLRLCEKYSSLTLTDSKPEAFLGFSRKGAETQRKKYSEKTLLYIVAADFVGFVLARFLNRFGEISNAVV